MFGGKREHEQVTGCALVFYSKTGHRLSARVGVEWVDLVSFLDGKINEIAMVVDTPYMMDCVQATQTFHVHDVILNLCYCNFF